MPRSKGTFTVPSSSAEKQADIAQVITTSPSPWRDRAGTCGHVGEEGLEARVVVVPQRPVHLREPGQVAVLVVGVPGMGGEPAEQVRPQHGCDHGSEAAGGLALKTAGAASARVRYLASTKGTTSSHR